MKAFCFLHSREGRLQITPLLGDGSEDHYFNNRLISDEINKSYCVPLDCLDELDISDADGARFDIL